MYNFFNLDSKNFYSKYNLIPCNCPNCTYNDTDLQCEAEKLSVLCLNCGLKGPIAETVEVAVDLWNKRFNPKEQCLFCGNTINARKVCISCGAKFNLDKEATPKKFACCFLDLLGFSSYTSNPDYDLMDAVRLIEDYATIIQQRSVTNAFKSFEYFHPASDSLFILGISCDCFVEDISKFCEQSIHLVSNAYLTSVDCDDVALTDVTVITPYEINHKKEHWFPPLFSGGITFGEVAIFTQESVYAKHSMQVPNFVGSAVTKAVHNGDVVHGARIILDESFVSKLSKETVSKYVLKHDAISELLWPMACFIDDNTVENNIDNGINELFEIVLKFYLQYKSNNRLEAVYFNTLKIIALSLIHYMKYRNATSTEQGQAICLIEQSLDRKRLVALKEELLDETKWRE